MKFPLIKFFKRPLPWLIGGILIGLVAIAAIIPLTLRNRFSAYDVNDYTVEATEAALKVRVTASGTVQPIQTVNLSPKNAGIVVELYVEQGDAVVQGQIIARMDNDDLQAELQQGRASLAEAQAQLQDVQDGNRPEEIAQAAAAVDAAAAQLRDAEARLALADQRLARNQDMALRGAISENELDGFVNESRSAIAGVDQAESRLLEAQERLADLRSQPEDTEIAAAAARVDQAQAQIDA
ncbi:MAG: biotin/lipoyl-binding protein, partial [Cyanobacteria bacterium J06659_2]